MNYFSKINLFKLAGNQFVHKNYREPLTKVKSFTSLIAYLLREIVSVLHEINYFLM